MERLKFLKLTAASAGTVLIPSVMQGCRDNPTNNNDNNEDDKDDNDVPKSLNKRLKSYLSNEFPASVTIVKAGKQKITIKGDTSSADGNIQLAEIPLWQDMTTLDSLKTAIPISTAGSFTKTVQRTDDKGYDRLISGWALVKSQGEGYQLLSALHYPDSVFSKSNFSPITLASKKGIGFGGTTLQKSDDQELGVATNKINIVLNRYIYNKPGSNRIKYEHNGQNWYIDTNQISRLDEKVEAAAENNRMVTAVILLQTYDDSSKPWTRDAAYPQVANDANYAMPNFTSRDGVLAYAAILNYLGNRYSEPGRRISGYIMHNEIQAPSVWTSAGNQKVVPYMNYYRKSMRMAHLLVRQYNPNMKPFISLDHNWTNNYTNQADRVVHDGKHQLDLMAKFSRKQGDFNWGIAFHPYPQDLRNPRTWADLKSLFSFDTPQITFRNLEVLDAYVQQEQVAFKGQEPREVQLTEQGLNSPDYGDKSLKLQAAGLAYAWKKIKKQQHITSFQYHRWRDNRHEGGLRLGLRKFSDTEGDPSGKKPIYDVFKAMDTSNEDDAFEFAKPIIGIDSWNEIHHEGQIK